MTRKTNPVLPWTYLGTQPYQKVWNLQEELRRKILAGEGRAHLLLTQHPPTISLGRGEKGANLRTTREKMKELGFDVVETNRGGKVTYHGPGQLVVYPVVNLRNFGGGVKAFVGGLEGVTMDCLGRLGITSERRGEFPGVWVGKRKIASVGIHVRKFVSIHGLALNVCTDLSHFRVITPCGIDGVAMTSMELEGIELSVDQALGPFLDSFGRIFGCALENHPHLAHPEARPRSVSEETPVAHV